MGSSSSIMRPEELIEFRKLNTTIENVEVPARAENRVVTDKKGFVFFGIAILLLIPCLVYTLMTVDTRLMTHDTDNCGNFCGLNNSRRPRVPCSGKDFRSKPDVDGNGECTKLLFRNEFRSLGGRSYTLDFKELMGESESVWWRYVLAIFFTIVLGVLTLVLLRFAPAPFVWGILTISMLGLLAITGYHWVLYFQNDEISWPPREQVPLASVIFWTIFCFIMMVILLVVSKRIGLVIQLYKETTKVLAAMPSIVFFPIFIAFIQIIVFIAAIVTTFWMLFAQKLTKEGPNLYTYQLSGIAIFTIVFNVIVASWVMRFIAGIQYMTIAGSVAQWYFSRNKDQLNSPVWTSFKITLKYHLGTIAFGSFLMTLFAVVKILLKIIFRNACCKCFMKLCCNNAEMLLKFLSGNSYIQTAIHGQSFLRSAKRATKLLLKNLANIVVISCAGDFILGVIIALVAVLASAISFALFKDTHDPKEATSICFVINIVIICVIFGTFQTIIDTLFICFCEDSIMNDGISRPYYMSRGLMEFIENSKKGQPQPVTE
ncbi:hypothetical protein Zmor_007961 [Zophobas morio]|uniref:Choline transporter-like protein n=1 Tax=Zophobas morio TaxID=2755281 RepID=A0AA38J363_9CUCU|nr:hypothetical protein Zmor_007961 [Zophobas morio]